jgi:hypothetical protein
MEFRVVFFSNSVSPRNGGKTLLLLNQEIRRKSTQPSIHQVVTRAKWTGMTARDRANENRKEKIKFTRRG